MMLSFMVPLFFFWIVLFLLLFNNFIIVKYVVIHLKYIKPFFVITFECIVKQ